MNYLSKMTGNNKGGQMIFISDLEGCAPNMVVTKNKIIPQSTVM